MPRKPRPDPIHDGSIGSYVARFFMCLILGVFADLLILAGFSYFIRAGWVFDFWFILVAIPLVFGVVGIFAFDKIVEIYEDLHRSHMNR